MAIMALALPTLSFTALRRITAGRASHQPSTDHQEPRSMAAAGFNATATWSHALRLPLALPPPHYSQSSRIGI